MKTTLKHFLFIICLMFIGIFSSEAQQVNSKIQEVYGDKYQELVTNDPEHLQFLNDIVTNRIKIIESPYDSQEKYKKLSEVALLNKYNSALTRDMVFDPLTFNPLKYDMVFSSKLPVVYRVDNTNYLIMIQPLNVK